MNRRMLRTAVVAATAALLAVSLGPVATATFSAPAPVTSPVTYFDGSLAIDASGVNRVAYMEDGRTPGVRFRKASNDNSQWGAPQTVADGQTYGASLVIDGAGKDWVAYGRVGSTSTRGLWLATDATGSWVATRLTSDDVGSPSMALDANGKLHIVFVSYGFSPGTYHVTNATGSWVRERIAAAHLHNLPAIAINGTTLRVAVADLSPEKHGIWVYTKVGSGAWSGSRVIQGDLNAPSIAIEGDGTTHVVARSFETGGRGLIYTTDFGGSWAQTSILGPLPDGEGVSDPQVRVDANGFAVVAAGWWRGDGSPDSGTYLLSESPAWGIVTRLAPASGPQDISVTDFEIGADGPHVAVTDWDPGMELAVAATGGSVGYEYLAWDSGAVMRVDSNGKRHVAFTRASADTVDGRIGLVSDATGPWVDDAVAADVTAPPAMVVDAAGHHHVAWLDPADGIVRYAVDSTGSWVTTDIGPGVADPDITLDAAGHPFIAFMGTTSLTVASNTTGTWALDDSAIPAVADAWISLGIDADGMAHVAWSDATSVSYASDVNGGWAVQGLAANADAPAVVVRGSSDVYIAYRRYGASAGTYLRRINRVAGTESTTRLTRSTAESGPSIALDPNGKVYVAFARYYWAANPGIYLVSNRTGSFVTTRTYAAEYQFGASIGVDSAGRASIAAMDDYLGISAIIQVDPLGTTSVSVVQPDGKGPDLGDAVRLSVGRGPADAANAGAGTGGIEPATVGSGASGTDPTRGSAGTAGGSTR